jgi:hypothetical protein
LTHGIAAYLFQVRLVTNPFAGENASKKKKYRGYAFIVFERESDMKGTNSFAPNVIG